MRVIYRSEPEKWTSSPCRETYVTHELCVDDNGRFWSCRGGAAPPLKSEASMTLLGQVARQLRDNDRSSLAEATAADIEYLLGLPSV